ncbi:hypothetical protein [Clostridium sp. 1001271B_151109_B4]|uniref:hypothetical protein n=1 Tax=Clostridium sp. 1001271B_151109_B4 TaxID=2787148 RepID=UPI0018AB1488|nr:hypothetical protein [Clostridium sp. 1001271B_151109_B4]
MIFFCIVIYLDDIIIFRKKLLNPEKEIYSKILNNCDLILEESMFRNDGIENIKGANEKGIKRIQ